MTGYRKKSEEALAGRQEAERVQREMSRKMVESLDSTDRVRAENIDQLCQQVEIERAHKERERGLEATGESHRQEMGLMKTQMEELRRHVVEKDQRSHQEITELRAQLASARTLGPVGGPPPHELMISQGIHPGVWGAVPTTGPQPTGSQTPGPARTPLPPFSWSSGTPQPAPVYQTGPGLQTLAGYQPGHQYNVQHLASMLHSIMSTTPQTQMPQQHQAQTPLQAPLTSQGLYGGAHMGYYPLLEGHPFPSLR